MGAIAAAIGDGVITGMWVLCASMFGFWGSYIATALEVGHNYIANIGIITCIIFAFVFVFGFIGEAFGGAGFNPTATAAFYVAGVGDSSLFSMALRFPAQAAGAVVGASVITSLMTPELKIGGPTLKVDLHAGAIAEGVLTFGITFAVLLIILRGPRNSFLQAWMLAIATIIFVVAGEPYTGPSMNPANAFGWAYVNKRHNNWDHFYVYWICPFVGAILAAMLFRVFFSPPKPKEKKA